MEKENIVKHLNDKEINNLKGYKITIEDLATGEKDIVNTDCFMGVIHNKGNKGEVRQICITECPMFTTMNALKALDNLSKQVAKEALKGLAKAFAEEE